MQTYQQTIQGGAAWSMNTAGRYFRIIEAPDAPVDIIFFRNGIVSGNAQGVGPGYWSRPAEFFSRIEISSPVTQTVKVAIADGDGGYDVVGITGAVSVINDDVRRAISGQEFIARLNANAAGAGNYTFLQLWNPAGSGKNLIVKNIGASCGTAGQVTIRGSDALISGAASGLLRRSKHIAASPAASTVTQSRVLLSAGIPADTGTLTSISVNAGLSSVSWWQPNGEVIVSAGAGLLWFFEIFNAAGAYAFAEWAEVQA